jgi:drug/metabolite transporter (DMT)-like permease
MAALCFVPLVWQQRAKLPTLPRAFWHACAELAVWNFLSQGLLNVALLYTDAMRVSFIAQTAIVLTPLLATSGGADVSKLTWAGALFALLGVTLLACDGGGAALGAAAGSLSLPSFSLSFSPTVGDALALGGAVTSSLYVWRIGEFSKKGLSTDLTQGVKVILLGALYTTWALVDGWRLMHFAGASGFSVLWPGVANLSAWLVLLYSALIPGALADLLQARGQVVVGSAEAQVLLGAEPLWTALLGVCLLGERLGLAGALGGGCIILAVLLASGVGGKKEDAERK